MSKTVEFVVDGKQVNISLEKVTIVEGEPFYMVFKGFKQVPAAGDIVNLKISDVKVLRYKSSNKSYNKDELATEDWNATRFADFSEGISVGAGDPGTYEIPARVGDSDEPNKAHRLIKFMLTVTLKSGAVVKIDPIIDERPT